MWQTGDWRLYITLAERLAQAIPGDAAGWASFLLNLGLAGVIAYVFLTRKVAAGAEVDEAKAEGERRAKELGELWQARYNEYVALSNQRLQDSIADWRGRLTEANARTEALQGKLDRSLDTAERLTAVVSSLNDTVSALKDEVARQNKRQA